MIVRTYELQRRQTRTSYSTIQKDAPQTNRNVSLECQIKVAEPYLLTLEQGVENEAGVGKFTSRKRIDLLYATGVRHTGLAQVRVRRVVTGPIRCAPRIVASDICCSGVWEVVVH